MMDSTDNAAKTSSSSEPLSGTMGDTSKGQPYDAGNMRMFSSITSSHFLQKRKAP
jgi:hypothetical protein